MQGRSGGEEPPAGLRGTGAREKRVDARKVIWRPYPVSQGQVETMLLARRQVHPVPDRYMALILLWP